MASVKKVIYISHGHLSEKVLRDGYMDYLQANGIIVEFWDLVTLLFGEIVEANSIHRNFVFTPGTYGEIEKRLRLTENRDAAYVMLLNFEGRFVKIYRLLSRYNCKLYFTDWGALPWHRSTPKWLKIIRALPHPLRLSESVFNKFRGIVYKKLKLIKPFDVVFAAGNAVLKAFPDAGKVVPTNSPDYDLYMKVKTKNENIVNGRYFLFLDVYLPFHPDLKIVGLKSIDANRYFLSLNYFFNIMEEKYGIKVVVAAHPHADYGDDAFQGREIYKGRTAELVRDAELVISQFSTSIGYAILNEKPIIFIYTDGMKRLYKYTLLNYTQDFANYLDANIYNIDEVIQDGQIDVRAINRERYNSYKYEFLTTRESEHTTAQDIFWREIANS